ncbi:Transcriptional repressor TCF25 domain containing protein [Naviculisporaceae sp. PSN 640]
MASRQLRKLRKQQELLEIQEKTALKDESDDEPVVAKPRANLFAGFAALGDEGDGDDNDSDEDEPAPLEAGSGNGTEQADGANTPAKKSKKKKNKKKKGKKPDISSTPGPGPEVQADPGKPRRDSLDEIDKALAELNIKKAEPDSQGPSAISPDVQIAELFHINFQHLKAMNELRKMFGNTDHMVELEQQPPQPRARGQQHVNMEQFLSVSPAPRQGRANALSETLLRSNPFVEGKKTWPRDSSHGLKMERLQQEPFGFTTFTFVQDKNYEELENQFFGLVQMGDPMQLVYFLHKHPYHVSSLIQVSKVAKTQDQNNALAADLIERALFTFGRIGLTEFRKKLEQGRARIDFYRPENRQLFLAGYLHIRNLTHKGTVLTALEWTKLLISLDTSDPYGLINFLHPLAIRANEAQWFVDLCTTTPLLDYFLPTGWYIKQTLVLAYLQLNNQAKAREALLSGMNKLPWLYCSLYSALNLDAPKCVWGIKPRDEKDEVHTALYLHMTKDLWDIPSVHSFLKTVPVDFPRNQDYADLPPSPHPNLATTRFIYLDNTPSLMSTLPANAIHGQSPNYEFDPLPPPRFQNVFTSKVQERPWRMSEEGPSAMLPSDNTPLGRAVRRMALERAVADAQRGVDVGARLDELAAMMNNPEWMVELRAEIDRRMEEWRARGGAGNADAPAPAQADGAPRRPFQAMVEEGDEDDNEDAVAGGNDGNADNQERNGGLMNMLFRAAGLFGGGGDGRRDAQPEGNDDFQGLPEQVYRALEDLELPDMPGGWVDVDGEMDGIDPVGDYSAITGQRTDGDGQVNLDRQRHASVESADEDENGDDPGHGLPGHW